MLPGKEESVGKDTTIAVDLAKSVFEVAVSDRPGRVGERQRLSRSALLPFFAQRPPARILLEACGTAHFWARELERLGHVVRLLPAQHVRRYRQGNKTDRADAKALLEAFRNEAIRPVPVKSPAQQELTALHRLRAAWHGTRTARINTLRGLLREQGIAIPAGAARFVSRALELAGDADSGLDDTLRFAAFELVSEIRELERRIGEVEQRLGFKLEPARPFRFTRQGDLLGWHEQSNGKLFLGLFVENGRIHANLDEYSEVNIAFCTEIGDIGIDRQRIRGLRLPVIIDNTAENFRFRPECQGASAIKPGTFQTDHRPDAEHGMAEREHVPAVGVGKGAHGGGRQAPQNGWRLC